MQDSVRGLSKSRQAGAKLKASSTRTVSPRKLAPELLDPEGDPAAAPLAPFPIVAVGASAGGLEALTSLLKALPARTGMAVVVIQHLAPLHDSALPKLLSNATDMPVLAIADGMLMQRNHVYVIPPNKSVTIQEGALRLVPRDHGAVPHHPIDEFYTALSRAQKTSAIGVILSGSGSDGTIGVRAIKAEGGVTFAQDPKTAAWPAMPANAISAGAADFILSPEGIAAELARIGRHSYLLKGGDGPNGNELEKIYALLHTVTGVDFRLYKPPTVSRRVSRRMALQKMKSLGDYTRFLRQQPGEIRALADDIFIHVTGFFRDPECFQALRKVAFPKLQLNRRPEPVRVWVPGCSTGEEVYSIAMLLLEALGSNPGQTRIQMFGTDVSEPAVMRARTGIYSESAMRGVSPARRKRFFLEVEHGFQVNKEVRGLCIFARHDLASDPPFSRLDLISCRNVLIYAGPRLQDRILPAFHYALKPNGFLFLGKSEAISAYSDIFEPVGRNHKIFLRKPKAGIAPHFDWREDDLKEPGLRNAPLAPAFDLQQAQQALLRRYAPPALVVDAELRILHFQGDLSPYVALSTGPPTVHLLKILRREFVVDLRNAIAKARRGETTSGTEPIHFEHDGHQNTVRVEVLPLTKNAGGKIDFLIVFREMMRIPEPSEERGPRKGTEARLERELMAMREYATSLISEHETVQEEMKAAHEEILSSSEELQSTNEELETAKEELQSSNEELLTLNEELRYRNLDLGVLTSDLNNLLVGVDIPVVVLNGALRIRRFTPRAARLLNLLETDVGRPFSDIAPPLDVLDWNALFAEVTSKVHSIEREVQDKSGHWHSLRIRPYRNSDNGIDGVIVILLDTDVIQRELVESRDYARMLLESAEQAIVAADAEGGIVLINRAAEKTFGYNREELLGKPLALLLQAGMPQPNGVRGPIGIGQRCDGRRKNGEIFPLEISLSSIDQAGIKMTVAFMTDITEHRRLENLSATYRAEIHALADRLITAQEEERRRVSRDLHDGLCQKLAALAFDVEHLEVALPEPAATRSRLRELRAQAVKVSEEARNIAYELHPSALDDLGLVVSMRALCDEFHDRERIQVKFSAGKLPESVPQKLASGLYRIAQEGLQNVAKHAKAKRVTVSLAVRDRNILEFTVLDDGIGFSPQAVKGKGGLGLVSIGERARIMGGDLSIEAKPGYGTRIAVRVPIL